MGDNRSETFAELFDVGKDILVTTLNSVTNMVTAQLGDSTSQHAETDNNEWWQHVGFVSRPAKPTQGGASCQGLCLKANDHDIIFATRDTRGSSIVGNLADGEACMYAPGAQGRVLLKINGSVILLTTDSNTATGNTMFAGLSPVAASGAAGGEWRVFAPWGQQFQDGTGYHLRTWHGARLDIGGMSLPAPFNIFGSSARLSADIIHLDAAVLQLGRDAGNSQPVVKAVSLQTELITLQTALADIQAALAGIAAVFSSFTGTGTFPGLTAFATLTSASSAAVTAANAVLSTIAVTTQTNSTLA